MGYRSDIVIALSKKAKLQNILFDNDTSLLNEADSTSSTGEADYYFFEGWKWYESYPEIQKIMDYLEKLDDEDYGFIRVGEETGDIEHLGNPWDYDIYVNTYIASPFD